MKFYNTNEVAELLQTTRRTIYNYMRDGKLIGHKVAGKWLFSEDDIKAFFNDETSTNEIPDSSKCELL